jgi:hypothetical protein
MMGKQDKWMHFCVHTTGCHTPRSSDDSCGGSGDGNSRWTATRGGHCSTKREAKLTSTIDRS